MEPSLPDSGGAPAAPPVPGRTGSRFVLLLFFLLIAGGVALAALIWNAVPHGGPVKPGAAPVSANPVSAPPGDITDAERKLSLLQGDLQNKLLPALDKLRADREDVKARLKAQGIGDSQGLKDNFKAQSLGQELAEVVGLIRVMEQKKATYERSTFELETLVRRLKRKDVAENAGLTEQELAEVDRTLKTIDAQLADVSAAPPELSAAQFDALIDDELGATSLEGRIDRQIETRKARAAALRERSTSLTNLRDVVAGNIADAENFRMRMERAIRQAKDEDRWPVKVAGRNFDQRAATEALARAAGYIDKQKGSPPDVAPLIEQLQKAAKGVDDEIAELSRLRERATALGPGADAANPKFQEIKSRVSEFAEKAVASSANSLLKSPVPGADPFDIDAK